jgi:hypothetical protein
MQRTKMKLAMDIPNHIPYRPILIGSTKQNIYPKGIPRPYATVRVTRVFFFY